MMPCAVAEMWLKGQVRDEELPALIHRAEQGLHLCHYPSSTRGFRRVIAWMFGVVALPIAALALFFFLASDKSELWITALVFAAACVAVGPGRWWLMRQRDKALARSLT